MIQCRGGPRSARHLVVLGLLRPLLALGATCSLWCTVQLSRSVSCIAGRPAYKAECRQCRTTPALAGLQRPSGRSCVRLLASLALILEPALRIHFPVLALRRGWVTVVASFCIAAARNEGSARMLEQKNNGTAFQ